MREIGRFSYSSLSLKPLSGKRKHQPFVLMLHLDRQQGSYVSFGRYVHRTLMLKVADKSVTTSTGGKK